MLVPFQWVHFVEKDRTGRQVPECAPLICAAYVVGFRLADDEEGNQADQILGEKQRHLTDFRGVSIKKLERFISLRIRETTLTWEKESFTILPFLWRCKKDAAFLRTTQRDGSFDIWMRALLPLLMKNGPMPHAFDPGTGRGMTAPIRCPEDVKRVIKKINRHFEIGWQSAVQLP